MRPTCKEKERAKRGNKKNKFLRLLHHWKEMTDKFLGEDLRANVERGGGKWKREDNDSLGKLVNRSSEKKGPQSREKARTM
jgi:hypothetical protein